MTCGLTGCDTEGIHDFMLLLRTSSITASQDRFPAHLSLHFVQ